MKLKLNSDEIGLIFRKKEDVNLIVGREYFVFCETNPQLGAMWMEWYGGAFVCGGEVYFGVTHVANIIKDY